MEYASVAVRGVATSRRRSTHGGWRRALHLSDSQPEALSVVVGCGYRGDMATGRQASDVPSVAAAQSQLQAAKKHEEALRGAAANERKAQRELRRQRDELRRMEAQVHRADAALQRAARSGASSVISGPRSARLSSARNTGAIVSPAKSRATIKEAVKSVDRQLRQSVETERAARKQLRGGR